MAYTKSVSPAFAHLPRSRAQAKLIAGLTGRWPGADTLTRLQASEMIDGLLAAQNAANAARQPDYGTRRPTARIATTYGGAGGSHYYQPARYDAPVYQPAPPTAPAFDMAALGQMIGQSVTAAVVAAVPSIITAVMAAQPAPVLQPVTAPASKPRANGKHAPVAAN